METVTQDIRYALSGFARNPIFTLTATVAIALGISASTAVQVQDEDWLALGAALTLLLGAALLAAWIPSRRAAGVDPLVALRQE